jgi:spore coat protein CotH
MICDKIEVSKDRVDITKMDETCTQEPEISGGYLLQGAGNGKRKDNEFFKTENGVTLIYEYPKPEDITEEQRIYLKNKINEIEVKVNENITDNIDLESFARYFIIEDFSGNQDIIFNSFYLYKERRDDKIYFGPVWDFDLAFDNAMVLYPTNEKKNFAYKFTLTNGQANKLLSNLLSNEIVLKKVKDTWKKMTNTVFTKEVMRDYINEIYELIYESQKLNYIRWDVLNSKQFMEAVIRGSFEAEVDYLKEFVEKRFVVFGEIIANATSASVLEEPPRQWPWGRGNRPGKNNSKKNETKLGGNNNDNN